MAAIDGFPQLPFERANLLGLAPKYFEMLAAEVISRVRTPVGDPAWLVTRNDQVRRLFSDERLGRTHADPEHAPRLWASGFIGRPIGSDHEAARKEHASLRRVLAPSFSARRMRSLRPRVQALVDTLTDELEQAGPPADLLARLAAPLPMLVICELLGVPYQDRDEFRVWSRDAVQLSDDARAQAGLAKLVPYMYDQIRRKRRDPQEDVLTDLARACEDGEITEDRSVWYAMALLLAGHEAPLTRIGAGTLFLLTHPDQWAALRSDPGLAPSAVEEIIRVAHTDLGVTPRWANTDIEAGGVTIQAGDLVLLGTGPASYDPAACADPDRFDIHRTPNPHVAFGHGMHFCVGANLGRLELEVVFTALARRLPGLRLAVPLESLRMIRSEFTGGLEHLPVTW
jgi:pentalenolactone synthase